MIVAIGPSSFAQADPQPMKMLQAAGIEIKPNPYGRRLTEKEIIAHLQGVDGLLAGLEPLTRKVLEGSSVKAIARVGIGMTNVDTEAARELDIKVSNTPDGPTRAVAEMTLTALLCLARDIRAQDQALHRGKWEKTIGRSISGLTVLIVGFGRIGRAAAKLMASLGAKILVHDPFLDSAEFPSSFLNCSMEDGLRKADVVSLHASGENCIIGTDAFAMMKEGCVLLNSARAELVDESALMSALDDGQLRSAWFDVFWKEPYEGKLREYDQVLLTPHTCTYTRECRLQMESQAAANLLRDLGVKSQQ
ncbi:MAG: phosphoglycerate dehydrogenase [Thermodesulfobacteriota bacterium]|nr:phosphoglycerate dehydrogenase [Thermodesulfobacteriota bacterium]